jgi:predicted NAD/FAD-binding protein
MIRVTVQVLDPKGNVLEEGSATTSSHTIDVAIRGLRGAFLGAGFHNDSFNESILALAEEIEAEARKEP